MNNIDIKLREFVDMNFTILMNGWVYLDNSFEIENKYDILEMVSNGLVKYLHICESELDKVIK